MQSQNQQPAQPYAQQPQQPQQPQQAVTYGQQPHQAPAPQPSRAPLDKGRIMGVVDEYQARENGQLLVNPDGSPKMKPKWWPIGECTKWMGQNGEYITRRIYVTPLKPGIYEQKEYWDSENPNPLA